MLAVMGPNVFYIMTDQQHFDTISSLGNTHARDTLFGVRSLPDQSTSKIMVRTGDWKYIFFSNGAREQLFHLGDDPNELTNRVDADNCLFSTSPRL